MLLNESFLSESVKKCILLEKEYVDSKQEKFNLENIMKQISELDLNNNSTDVYSYGMQILLQSAAKLYEANNNAMSLSSHPNFLKTLKNLRMSLNLTNPGTESLQSERNSPKRLLALLKVTLIMEKYLRNVRI